MLQAFGIDPQNSNPKDGYWCYKFTDNFGISLKFSFNIFEGSIQTTLSIENQVVQIVSMESEGYLRLVRGQGNYILSGQFHNADTTTTLEIQAEPRILVKWSSLVG